jgi:cation diffusion facilitator CzcD-associated flavoprotein CzcO
LGDRFVTAPADLDVAIVGSGFSGIAMAVALQRAGVTSYRVFEKAPSLGGTWRDNTYPGAACDVPSHLYSFSFAPNPGWSRSYSPQAEILAYLERCADTLGVRPHIRFNAEVTEARFDADAGLWRITLRDGETFTARALCLGVGALHVPALPDIPGRDTFAGPSFHSARWDHAYDLADKTVAVVGTGASAIQFVPQVAPQVRRLHLFQRTPAWVVPKDDRAIAPWAQQLYAAVPAAQRAVRAAIYLQMESRAVGFVWEPRILRALEVLVRLHIRRSVPDPVLRDKLTPRYRMGCKRILLANDYYPALVRPNVEVVTDGIAAIEPEGGSHRGRAAPTRRRHSLRHGILRHRLALVGEGDRPDGRTLNEAWQTTPEAYLGITVSGFPNLYMLMGPNTGLGHNSMVFMIEAQARYAAQCVARLKAEKIKSLDVRPAVQSAFNATLRGKMKGTVWTTGCVSWYRVGGGDPVLWPGFTVDYWRRTRRVDFDDYTATH